MRGVRGGDQCASGSEVSSANPLSCRVIPDWVLLRRRYYSSRSGNSNELVVLRVTPDVGDAPSSSLACLGVVCEYPIARLQLGNGALGSVAQGSTW